MFHVKCHYPAWISACNRQVSTVFFVMQPWEFIVNKYCHTVSFKIASLLKKGWNVEVHSLFRYLFVNGVASVGINHHLVECTTYMYCDGNRSRYGAVLLIMVWDMLISSSNLDSQMCPLWMTFYVFKLLWSHFPAVTDTCFRCRHHCHTEAL